MAKSTLEEFIKKSKELHGNIYDYNKTIYINAKDKLIITCIEHGNFIVSANKHLDKRYKQGCPICTKNEQERIRKEKSLREFYIEAKEIHGNKYDYSEVYFEKRKEKIKIHCMVDNHPPFEQTVDNHLQGQGCPKCGREIAGLKRRTPEDEFFNDCSYIHENQYDYSNTKYNGMFEPIYPTCIEHGEFEVLAVKHYHRKQGCPICSEKQLKSKPVREIERYFNENNISYVLEKKFDECKNRLHLPFDFYIESMNLLIEYDGIQHYKPIEYFGGENGLKEQQHNDEIKNKFCKDNGINLLRIKYNEKHIEVLKEYFK